ncbi:MAG: 4-hydroxy-tetrahydrodipicolinate reductase [Elusimicrobia bacterium]|nr:4-hydroxy-tetrahydrodipicolinate reductase [Elusimicrobiota bacterium]
MSSSTDRIAGRVKIVISGLNGRMGSRIASLLEEGFDSGVLAVGGIVREPQHQGSSHAFPIGIKAIDVMEPADVLVEFTTPAATLSHLEEIQDAKKAAVVGTTGLSAEEWKRFEALSRKIAILYDTNFSLGIALIRRAIVSALKDINADFDCSIVEIHHKGKKDAPSGTAKDLAELMVTAVGEKPDVFSLRLGEVPGEHKIYLATPYEVLELSHRVYSRDAFAAGAIYASKWIYGQKPGLYRFLDVLNYNKEFDALAR